MSPEQAEGRSVDHRSDIFSMGIILYEMATGQRPFQDDTTASILSSIIKELVGDLDGAYSRRINVQHRLVYQVLEKERTVKVLRMWTHYEQRPDLEIALNQASGQAMRLTE
jgi:serine/threonine protein kinase